MTPKTTLPRRITAGYAAGSVGTGGFGVLPGLVLAYYLTDTLGVAALLASVVVVAPKLVDVVINPLIGARSDRDAAATGSRVKLMWIGTAVLFPAFILTFCAPADGLGGALWVLAAFTVSAVAYACFQVPYIALPAELTGDYHERTRLISVRIAVLALTILVIGAGAPAVRDAVGGRRTGYAVMAVAAAVLIAAGMIAAVRFAAGGASAPLRPSDSDAGQYRDAFDALRTNRHYRILLTVFVVQALATAVMLAGAQYLATYVLDDPAALTPLFAALVAPAMLVMPLWVKVGGALGKQRALLIASSLFLVAALGLAGAMLAPGAWVFGVVALAGIGYAGMQTFPLAMLPDVIDEHTRRTGADRGGALAGLWTAGETLGMAVGPGLYLLVLASTGFVSSAGATPDQSAAALAGIAGGFSLLPAALIAVSIVLLLRYHRKDAA